MHTATTLAITSSAFEDDRTISMSAVFDRMGCKGQNQSPDLSWTGAPPNTQSYAISLWDPDVPTGVGAVHGFTDYGFARYGGPCPAIGEIVGLYGR